jgi:uncharacterized protein (TIGR04255 family)
LSRGTNLFIKTVYKRKMNKLPKAPLQEVILEVRWGSAVKGTPGVFIDPGYAFALGKFQAFISARFPVSVKKFPLDIPPQVIGNQPDYQFWSEGRTWPVIQLGPGVLTVNDTEKNYEWAKTFFPLASETIEHLFKAYSENLKFSGFSLRYIDVVKTQDYGFSDWPDFIKKQINFSFDNQYNTRGKLKNFSFDQVFELEEGGNLQVILSNGTSPQNDDLFVIQISVNETFEVTKEELLKKIEAAHNHTSAVFKEICKKAFYASFN